MTTVKIPRPRSSRREEAQNIIGWRTVKLGEVCELNPRRPKLDRPFNSPTTFVQMSAVDENGGGIARPELRPYGEVIKGYTFFGEGDVIFAKITPCMQNGKHAIARNLQDGIGFGSTEFHVLRPTNEILPEWIHSFLMQPSVMAEAEADFTGSGGQLRVPEKFLAEVKIPLPPLDEQRRLAAQLRGQMTEVERARSAVQAQLDAAQTLPAALLRVIFEGAAARRWPRHRLGDSTDISSGITLGRKVNGRPTRSVPYLRVANVKDGHLDLTHVKEVEATENEIRDCQLLPGDVLLTEGGDPDKLGRGTFWRGEIANCIHQNHIFRVRSEATRFEPAFLAYQFGSSYGKAYFFAHGKQTTGIASINKTVLSNFPLMVPPLAEQQKIAARLDAELTAARSLIETLEARLGEIELLPATFLRAAFDPNKK